jgi:hypothetical protein
LNIILLFILISLFVSSTLSSLTILWHHWIPMNMIPFNSYIRRQIINFKRFSFNYLRLKKIKIWIVLILICKSRMFGFRIVIFRILEIFENTSIFKNCIWKWHLKSICIISLMAIIMIYYKVWLQVFRLNSLIMV